MEAKRIVLCGASAYEQKYYFNEQFQAIPDSVKEELRIICVLFTEEVGGVLTMVFEEDGTLSLETEAEEDDIYYDEISSGLLIGEIRRKRQELLESLSLYYRVFILKEDISSFLEEEAYTSRTFLSYARKNPSRPPATAPRSSELPEAPRRPP